MQEIVIKQAKEEDFPYIKEKLKNYILDDESAHWKNFFVAQQENKTIGFGRIIDRGEYFEIASLAVDYYHRKKGIGRKVLFFLAEEAQRLNREKPIYCVTHIPTFFEKLGFKEILTPPEVLKTKKRLRCKLKPSESKIMKLTTLRKDG